MPSMVVAIALDPRTGSRVAARLKGLLTRRGFRVQFVKGPQGMISGECDILLLPCRAQKVRQLADQITQEWTHRWLEWYATQRFQNRKWNSSK